MEKKFNFVFVTTNLINGKQYIGDHATNRLNDKYLGSGRPYFKSALKKYNKENFERKILEFFPTKQQAFDAQEKWIIEYNTLIPNGYNLSPKGGHNVSGCWNIESKKKLGKTMSKLLTGRIFTQIHKDNLKKAKIGYIPSVKGIGHKQQFINVYGIDEGLKKYEQFIKKQRDKKIGKKMKNPVWNKGIPSTELHKQHVSEALKGKKHNLKEVECTYCRKKGKGGNMTRYHFNNCKFKNNDKFNI